MKRILLALAILALIGGGAFWFLTSPSIQKAGLEPVPGGTPDLANGRTIFLAGGCASCHATPKQEDKTRLGGGLALKSPFGTFNVPNISPHPGDGIGSWTEAQFQRAMRGGVSPDGRHYYPAFPYAAYQRLANTDIRDLFAYLKSLPAVEGRAPEHDLPFPFNVRRGVGLWKLAVLDGKAFMPDPSKSPSLNRGADLVEAAGHCAECHSPRNALGMIPDHRRYAGGPNPEGEGWVPNITPDATGIKDYSKGDVAEILSSGMIPSGDFVGGPMAPVVANTSELSAADRDAMAEYLLSLPPRAAEKRPGL